jgi:response regulator of citrate/malate metabolism
MTFGVLVVEDERIAAEAHATYVSRVPDFAVAAVAYSCRDALVALGSDPDIDLLLLDMHLPDGHGLDLLRRLRAGGVTSDVLAVTSVRELEVVRRAMAQGVIGYLIKPFTFSTFSTKLAQYADFRTRLEGRDELAQDEIDAAIGALRPRASQLPKGLTASTLAQVTATLRRSPGRASASVVAEAIGSSRVTARRYLEHLVECGLAERISRHGAAGRPEIDYAWAAR